jgi:hypothetical protein
MALCVPSKAQVQLRAEDRDGERRRERDQPHGPVLRRRYQQHQQRADERQET